MIEKNCLMTNRTAKSFKYRIDKYWLNKIMKQERELNGLSQSAMGKVLGVSDKTISAYENQQILPSAEVLYLFLKEFNYTLLIKDGWGDTIEFVE